MKRSHSPILAAAIMAAAWLAAATASGFTGKPLPWLEDIAQPLDEAAVMEELIGEMKDRRLVLLGESTHGTHEFYVWRDRISRQLVADAGFQFLLVEGDWASLHELNRYVKHLPGSAVSAREALASQQRWPQWLWANEETVALGEWLRQWNEPRAAEERVGIHGMDVYAPWLSADLILSFTETHLPAISQRAAQKLSPMQSHRDDMNGYVREHMQTQADVMRGYSALLELVRDARDDEAIEPVEWFAAKQAVHVIIGAHRHFMGMAEQGPHSWNRRAEHMHQTARRMLNHRGENSRGIVWAHNTHIGDSRATDMAARGQINIGRLSRDSLGRNNVFALGFATHRGRVIAGSEWGSPLEEMEVPPGMRGSLEALLDSRFPDGALFMMNRAPAAEVTAATPQRAIGVVYDPCHEQGNYVHTRPADRYDALIFIPETRPLSPLTDDR